MTDERREMPWDPLDELTSSRRSFLKLAGFGVASAALSACSRAPIEKAIPWLVRSDTIVPGRAYWIATTCGGCPAGCGMLARCRDGRPIKLEGNRAQPLAGGGLCAAGQAQVLAVYDSHRLARPRIGGAAATWEEVDRQIAARLADVRARRGRVRLLSGTDSSPSTRSAIDRFLATFADARHVVYDPISSSARLDAHAATHGVRVLPRARLDRTRVIAAFDDDFLGAGVSPVEHAAARQRARDPDAPTRFARHVQFESRMSLTGSRADRRITLAPWETGPALLALLRRVATSAGTTLPAPVAAGPAPVGGVLAREIDRVADELWAARGTALVLCGTNDLAAQKLANAINHLLGAYGVTLDLEAPSQQRLGDDRSVAELRGELDSGAVDVLMISGCNPVAELDDPRAFADSLRRVALVVRCDTHDDETAALAHFVLPVPHFLETWHDAEPVAGLLTFTQPTVGPLREARSLRRTLALWSGDGRDDRALIAATYSELVARRRAGASAPSFERALESGFALLPPATASHGSFNAAALEAPAPATAPPAGALAVVLHATTALPDGRHAQNPWLQELPDPVTKVTWDNVASLAPATAARLGVATGDVVRLSAAGVDLELPALVQQGQHEGVVAIALGYGRKGTERFAVVGPQWLEAQPTVAPGGRVGVNAAPLLLAGGDGMRRDGRAATVSATGRRVELACTQDHHTLSVPEHLAPAGGEVRDAVQTVSLAELVADPARALARGAAAESELWSNDHRTAGPQWGMAVDLNACTGCSACVIGCQAENNVPVVGRDEVRRHREMHWIRIDRYWYGEPETPRALHQPMMCQQCGHAPCETVCPVLATVHGSEGLNQQIYNRCVGTRYCANNCPYKVRRFNWFDYPRADQLENLALNPDVTVRSRGVMEKCSFCVQRILEAKLEAKEAARPLADGDIEPACQQSCPAQAIVFGNLADPESRVAKLTRSRRAYRVLDELNVQPAVTYLAHVREGRGAAR